MRKKLRPVAAEIEALRDHILALDKQFSVNGFHMATDTRRRLARAEELLVSAETAEDEDDEQQWLTEADALCVVLRAEAGVVVQNAQSGATPTGE